jgi:hypothetical protein
MCVGLDLGVGGCVVCVCYSLLIPSIWSRQPSPFSAGHSNHPFENHITTKQLGVISDSSCAKVAQAAPVKHESDRP